MLPCRCVQCVHNVMASWFLCKWPWFLTMALLVLKASDEMISRGVSSVCIMLPPSHQILLAVNGAKHASEPLWNIVRISSLNMIKDSLCRLVMSWSLRRIKYVHCPMPVCAGYHWQCSSHIKNMAESKSNEMGFSKFSKLCNISFYLMPAPRVQEGLLMFQR